LRTCQKDPNREDFRRENGGLFQIEIDAMQKDPEKFKNLVLSAVNHYFVEKTHKKVMGEYTPEDIEKLSMKE
jgi:hypothetical protein